MQVTIILYVTKEELLRPSVINLKSNNLNHTAMFYSIPTLATMFTIASCSKEKSENEVSEIRKSTPMDFYRPFAISAILCVLFFLTPDFEGKALCFAVSEFFCYALCVVAAHKRLHHILTAVIPFMCFVPLIIGIFNEISQITSVEPKLGECLSFDLTPEYMGIMICSAILLISFALPLWVAFQSKK